MPATKASTWRLRLLCLRASHSLWHETPSQCSSLQHKGSNSSQEMQASTTISNSIYTSENVTKLFGFRAHFLAPFKQKIPFYCVLFPSVENHHENRTNKQVLSFDYASFLRDNWTFALEVSIDVINLRIYQKSIECKPESSEATQKSGLYWPTNLRALKNDRLVFQRTLFCSKK